MVSSITSKVIERINTLEVFLRWFEIIEYPYTDGSDKSRAVEVLNFPRGDMNEERILRHCSIISRLYSIYEKFAEDALSFWILKLQSYCCFNELSEQLRNKYRIGISRIIRDIDKKRFRHLNLETVLVKYLNGLGLYNDTGWDFIKEGLVHHEANLRRKELEALFIPVGFDNFWKKLEDNKNIINYKDSIDEGVSLENLLEDFVNYRNEAAHGSPDEIIGVTRLREWIRFIEALCLAIEETITHKILKYETDKNPEIIIGHVVHRYNNNIIIADLNRCNLKNGQELYFLENNRYTKTKIISLQLGDVEMRNIWSSGNGLEVGIKTQDSVGRNASMIMIKSI